ncbi:MAG: hypothetical protein FWD99_08435 [Oscillospiraceae bacterium]|nr:hypothetical protein [Oscillospiraceae bacterium]
MKPNIDINEAQRVAAARSADLDNLVGSKDGQRVKSIMEQESNKLKQAVAEGDLSTLKNTFDNLMRTEEGARLIGKIQNMISK